MAVLTGKSALITGAASGIGLATARLFVAEGARVHLVDLSADGLSSVVSELGAENASSSVADVTDGDAVAAAVSAAVDALGRLDIVVSNAGISGPVAPLPEYPLAEFRRVLDVHVVGAFNVLQHALPHVADRGSVIITSSITGLRGVPEIAGYVTAKHAQVGLMRTAALESVGRGIRVNTIHPGPVDNGFQADIELRSTGLDDSAAAQRAFDERIPLGRHATNEEIAQAMLYLASDASAMVTSTTFRVDGGMGG